MARDVEIVGDALVDLINGAGLGQPVTAERVYEPTTNLADLDSVSVQVFPAGKTKTRLDRSQITTTQVYACSVRKRCSGTELNGETIDRATLDDWSSFVENLENIKWSGKFSELNANINSVETVAAYDVEMIRSESTFAAALTFEVVWHKKP